MASSSPRSLTADDDETVTREPVRSGVALGDLEPALPRTLGRYVVLDEIGVGGMGRVHRAHDPKLDREVAIKVLRDVGPDARSRLRREAQAMARLAHPNVLPVYDVADDGALVFIAMELVRGRSLREWIKGGQRRWSEVLDVLVAAGRGLAAAHEAGLVHRDFKPANVLLGDDGRVRVMDFGLARAASGADELSGVRRSSGSWPRVSDDGSSNGDPDGTVTRSLRVTHDHAVHGSLTGALTQTGTVLGTPAYMAPEQHEGHAVDQRCDQYAFCVTLWEALHGRRPFDAKTLADWYRAKLAAAPRTNPERRVPRWLHAVLLRGLAPRPGDRFPSMTALLEALAQGLRRRRQRRTLGLLLAGAVLAGGIGAALDDPPRICIAADDKLAGIWDDPTAAEVEAAMLASHLGYAADTWARVEPQLADYAARWRAAHQEACEATHVRHEQPEALMDARMRCLHDRRRSLRALVHTLRAADAETIERAVSAVGALPAIEPCADADYVRAQAPPPANPQQAAEADAIGEELARIDALVDTGRAKQVEPDARAVVERAVALGHGPLEVRARLRLGSIEDHLGRYDASAEQFQQAYFVAQREGLDRLQAEAAAHLVHVLGGKLGRHAQAEQWARHAEAALEREPDPAMEARYLGSRGVLALDRGDATEALALLERALALRERQLGPDHPQVAMVLNNLALVHDRMSRLGEAEALHERALAIRERALGPMHPLVASTLLNMASVDIAKADHGRSRERLLRALAIYEGAYGREHPFVASALVNLGKVHEDLGESRLALARYEEALPILEAAKGPEHTHVIGTLVNIGTVHLALGEPERARERFDRALERLERSPGRELVHAMVLVNMASLSVDERDLPRAEAECQQGLERLAASGETRHPVKAVLLTNLGLVRAAQGRHEDALRLQQEALALRRELLGPRHPETAALLAEVGRATTDVGKPEEAIELIEEAIEVLAGDGTEAVVGPQALMLQQARYSLARAWWDAGVRRRQAVQLVRKVRAELHGDTVETRGMIEEMDAWLAERGAPKDSRGARRASPP